MRQAWADSVAAELIQDGGVLTGTLCAGGLPTDPTDPLQTLDCGPIVDGRIEGRHVRFGAKLWIDVLSIDAEVSADGTRMGGRYLVDEMPPQLTAWWPLDARSGWVDPQEGWPSDLLPFSCGDPAYNPGYDLTLVDAPAGSSEFTPDRTYLVVFCAGIAGDLGAFGGADLHVTTEGGRTTTIVAGPVRETTPTPPTTVTLHFADGLLTTVEARTPSGATYSFRATRSSGGGI
jgi:hypothetical protein